MAVERFDLRALPDDSLRAIHEFEEVLRQEAMPEEPPRPLQNYLAAVRTMPSFVEIAGLLVRDEDGAIAGESEVVLLRMPENPHMAQVALSVRPDLRRLGLARTLLADVVDVARADQRSLLVGVTNDRVPAGAEFVRRIGGEAVLESHVNRLLLRAVDRGLVDAWVREGPDRARGYSLVSVDGACPEELVEQVAALLDVMNDAPRGRLEMEDQHITVESLREIERQTEAVGGVQWWVFARHDVSGQLVGFTEVTWNPARSHTVDQGNTGVVVEHRGHGLGKWMKAVMLRRILGERPECVDVRTGNADSNAAMLSINAQLGFEPYIALVSWQVRVERVRDYLNS